MILDLYCQHAKLELRNLMLARYLLELALLEYATLKFDKVLLVASAIYLVNKIRRVQPAWASETMVKGIEEANICLGAHHRIRRTRCTALCQGTLLTSPKPRQEGLHFSQKEVLNSQVPRSCKDQNRKKRREHLIP